MTDINTSEVYEVTIKTRAIIKTTALVCVTIFSCKVAADIAAPYVSLLALKLTERNDALSTSSDRAQVE
jgi:hypothetical protein